MVLCSGKGSHHRKETEHHNLIAIEGMAWAACWLYVQWAAAVLMRALSALRERDLEQDYEGGAIEMKEMGGALCCVHGDAPSCQTSTAKHCRTLTFTSITSIT